MRRFMLDRRHRGQEIWLLEYRTGGASLGMTESTLSGSRNIAPIVSVVTVTMNSAATVARTIDSVLSQNYQAIDYVVVDGGSTDGTVDILKGYGDRLRFVSEADSGMYDAMNKGIRMARGDWIHILNSDDYYVSDDMVTEAVSELDPNRTNYFDMYREYANGTRELQSFAFRHWRLYISAYLPHPSLVVARSQYDAVGLYDTQYRIAGDHDMILRLLERFPARHHHFPLTVMAQGGVSGRLLSVSLNEFYDVTRARGLPGPAASAIRVAKKVWWGARSRAR